MTDAVRSAPGPQSRSIQKLFDDTRKRLVETGTRNRLVHVNRANTRSNVVNIVNERSDDVHAILLSGRAMRFLGLGLDKAGAGEIVLADDHDEAVGTDRFTDNQLETRLGPDALAKRLLKIAREAQTAEEEQGVNILYLALGFVTWFEDKNSAVAREAPLVLLPVQLVRNQRTSTYDLKLRDDDLMTNLPLQQRWQDDFGIALPEIDNEAEDWRPGRYFDAVEAIVAGRPKWRIDRAAIQLGFFSFSKLLMYRDLALEAWPEDALAAHDLTRGLLYEGFKHEAPLFGREDRLDALLPPDKLFHVVDADASQAKVIEEVRAGRNLVVQGPPGTGKSQTITNIIAAAAKEGKTVLFVAEKMAALSVVHDRLVKVGLRDLILELHSKTASKKTVLAELARTLAAGQAVPAVPPPPDALRGARDRLNALADALHAPIGETGETPYTLLGRQARYLGMGAPMPTLSASAVVAMTRADEAAACERIGRYAALVAQAGPVEAHPFAGVEALDFQPVALTRLKAELGDAARAAATLRAALDMAMAAAGLDGERSQAMIAPVIDLLGRVAGLDPADADLARSVLASRDRPRLVEALDIAARWQAARHEAATQFVDSAFAEDVGALRGPVVAGTTSFFARWGGAYRGASRTLAGLLSGALPKLAGDRLALVDQLGGVQVLRRAWCDDEAFVGEALGGFWRGERTDFARAAEVAQWADHALASPLPVAPDRLVTMGCDPATRTMLAAVTAAAPPAREAIAAICVRLMLNERRVGGDLEAADLAVPRDIFEGMAAAIDRYGEWAALCGARKALDKAGLGALAERIATGALDSSRAVVELKFARAERLWETALETNSALKDIARLDRHALVDEFTRLERSQLKENVTTILAGHLAQLPQGAQGEMKIVRGEIGKRRAHMALRRLFLSAPRAIQRIKPVLLMSPISVAQYLTPGQIEFDLLVIDEASQVRPEDALGVIARARQIVVVGDEKQLPPSSFFDRLLSDGGDGDGGLDLEDEDEGEDLLGGAAALGASESILTLCEARGLPARMLQWHYRSRDPSLMRVSNAEFYKSELVLPPSPLEKDPAYGLIFTRVDGAYDKGGRRDNRREGDAIVRRVAEHARATPDLSLGIVTFSHAQKNTINELLELARRGDQALDGFLREGRAEDLFVKNIENVQGDERDVILISVGYGPTEPGGRMIGASFGPVNGEGGERRLNVLFTRARLRCEVFASFDPGDLDVSRAARDGPRILKRYLDYAKSGALDQPTLTGELPDSPFEEDVADVVRSLGYLADPQVGSAGFRVDIGVRHPDRPGHYLLAIECDGATYHSALWARERDRLRQDVLEHLGWRFHRIWSTDWFYDRRTQIERLRAALEAARATGNGNGPVGGSNTVAPQPAEDPIELSAIRPPEVTARQMPAYVRARPWAASAVEPHEAPLPMLEPLVAEVVDVEGPVHIDEVARRIAGAFGKRKAGKRVLAVTRHALVAARRKNPDLLTAEDFWFTSAQAADPAVRDRTAEDPATCKADALSMIEIRAALRLAREDNPGGSDDELVRAAARLMGFRRVGGDLQARFSAALE